MGLPTYCSTHLKVFKRALDFILHKMDFRKIPCEIINRTETNQDAFCILCFLRMELFLLMTACPRMSLEHEMCQLSCVQINSSYNFEHLLQPPCMTPLGLQLEVNDYSLIFDIAVSSGEASNIRLNGERQTSGEYK